ncbi:septation protein SepH [Kribbella sp. NPDC004536]|uniref:septation protein SepH n=1 Tax=Kribbella sp. NPDC004536 TaxID=3364106 RepID=UPI0036B1532D
MREARLVGLSQDGTQLILAVAETGEEFAVPVDDRLRAALRGDRARLGQLEIQMESALRPRDIQARIRAGESPEAVAAVAQMPMERVMAFAGPVLAERDHIASLAQRASVRRRGGGDAPTRNLGAWVTDRLRLRQVDPASAEWDAWRREDGRWAVRVSYFVEAEDNGDPEAEKKDEKVAMFAYDAPGRYAVPDDDEARWLVGEQAQVLPTPVQPQPGERRLAAVADIDPLIAPDHGADSYEAGFEDTVALRRRNHPVSERPDWSDREATRRDVSDRDAARRDPERGPRRVHSVPNPDEEPTLIDVPVDQPPAPRPSVRAVERPADPPAFASPAEDYPEEHTARNGTTDPQPTRAAQPNEVRHPESHPTRVPQPNELRQRDARSTPSRTTEPPVTDPRSADPRSADPRSVGARSSETRPTASRPAPSSPTEPRPAPAARAEQPPRPADPRITDVPSAEPAREHTPTADPKPEAPAAQLSEGTENGQTEDAAEPKKKPARRGKRASVPSWDEIMFGKKAD